jgi:hypothetical protein
MLLVERSVCNNSLSGSGCGALHVSSSRGASDLVIRTRMVKNGVNDFIPIFDISEL